jgi:hypothetical protein
LANIARERRRELDRSEYNNIQEIVRSGRTYEWQEFSDLLERMRKPFSCSVDGRDVTVTEADAAIMMEKSALDGISKILVSNKRTADGSTNQPTAKRKRNNAACNTTRGATGFDALHGAARRDHRENKANEEKLLKGNRREKEAINKLLTLVEQRKKKCAAAGVAMMEATRVARERREVDHRERERQRDGRIPNLGESRNANLVDLENDGEGRLVLQDNDGGGRSPRVATNVGGRGVEAGGSDRSRLPSSVQDCDEDDADERLWESIVVRDTIDSSNRTVEEYWQVSKKSLGE